MLACAAPCYDVKVTGNCTFRCMINIWMFVMKCLNRLFPFQRTIFSPPLFLLLHQIAFAYTHICTRYSSICQQFLFSTHKGQEKKPFHLQFCVKFYKKLAFFNFYLQLHFELKSNFTVNRCKPELLFAQLVLVSWFVWGFFVHFVK